MKTVVMGILAHVDAGKTTLSEAMLYECGVIRSLGRVDKGNTFLERDVQERERGITIFSKQARFKVQDKQFVLLDTPGHVDFSAEAERTLQVLDLAVLVVSASDGVQGHTMTLWKLLQRYGIPVFVFVNKMDQPDTDPVRLMQELQQRLSLECVDFSDPSTEEFRESVAMCGEAAMEQYLQTGTINREEIVELIRNRQLFPCFFGSALKQQGVRELLDGMADYGSAKTSLPEFGARIYKITRDEQGNRLSHMKITGGELKVKTVLSGKNQEGMEWQEKVNQIRCYCGEKYELADTVSAGDICTVTGLSQTFVGQGLGSEAQNHAPLLEPVMSYRVIPEKDAEMNAALEKMKLLEEEDPLLRTEWNPQTGELTAHVMGPVQIEILERLMKERYDIAVTFGKGRIMYKETIRQGSSPVEGVGHFEPLRHYAEVHLLLQPGEMGSGFVCDTDCSEDELDRNWQRLIVTHLTEKEYRGVLTGAPVTDIHVTLKSGRAHLKHTEGGDFRQATYRAVRQGLMQADIQLLEPYMEFRLELPEEYVGRAMTDLSNLSADFENEVEQAGSCILKGRAPMQTIAEYGQMVIAYTRGRGIWSMNFDGYGPCHNQEEVIAQSGYDAERDVANTADSVFCAHGAGFVVPWYEVPEYMHLPSILSENRETGKNPEAIVPKKQGSLQDLALGTEEIDAIIERSGSANRRKDKEDYGWQIKRGMRTVEAASNAWKAKEGQPYEYHPKKRKEEYILIDGYNVIFAWEELKDMAAVTLDGARGVLLDRLCNYQAIDGKEMIVVFDAYRLQGHPTECLDYHNIHVVYTKEAETADHYIERFTHEYSKKYEITVVTSDGLEQMIIIGQNCHLISSREFEQLVTDVSRETMEDFERDDRRERRFGVSFPKIPQDAAINKPTAHP